MSYTQTFNKPGEKHGKIIHWKKTGKQTQKAGRKQKSISFRDHFSSAYTAGHTDDLKTSILMSVIEHLRVAYEIRRRGYNLDQSGNYCLR